MNNREISSGLFGSEYDYSNNHKGSSKKRIKITHQLHEISHNDNIGLHSSIKSSFRNLLGGENEKQVNGVQDLPLTYFQQKYAQWGSEGKIDEEMKRIENHKNSEINSLRIYRDELKLFSGQNLGSSPKLPMNLLKNKANQQSRAELKQREINDLYDQYSSELDIMAHYLKFLGKNLEEDSNIWTADIIDVEKQEELIIKNLEMETAHLIRELAHEHQRNNREIREVQEEILSLRIEIKQKEDRLRDLKAKMCTMYIKLHSKNDSRMGSKSRDKNLSLSIKKFNNKNHGAIQQAFIGNSLFKNYSRELLEKVNSEQQVLKIRFYYYDAQYQTKNKGKSALKKEKFTFQCIYKEREGFVHSEHIRDGSAENYNEVTRDKISEQSCVFEEVQVKYLLSMKFYYKSKIVGVECRIKTDRGNKHVQIGCCDANVQYQLLTLINKNIITLGSFWHGKEMIGVSLWFKNRDKIQSSNDMHSRIASRKGTQNYSSEKRMKSKKKIRNERVFEEYYA